MNTPESGGSVCLTGTIERFTFRNPDSGWAVLRLLDLSLKSARHAGVPSSVCGQMGGEAVYTMLLLGLGLRVLSVPPSAVPEIKKICRSVSIPQCEEVAQRALAMEKYGHYLNQQDAN